jgi:hypothetical protein
VSSLATSLRFVREGIAPVAEERRRLVEPDLERYRRDPFAHCDDGHVKVVDLASHQLVEFHPWPHQREAVEAWIDIEHLRATGILRFRNLHEEKSRQMGMTQDFAVAVHWALTYHSIAGGMIHRRLSEVCDSGPTPRSFFGKVKVIQENFPAAYRKPLKFVTGNAPLIRNEDDPLAFFIGEGATLDPTRGGTYSYFLLDEAARIPWGEAVHMAVSRSTPTGRVYNSTPHGKGNVYYRLREQRPAGYSFLRHHWADHPLYGQGAHISAVRPRVTDTGREVPGYHSPQPTPEMTAAAQVCRTCQGTVAGIPWDAQNPLVSHRYSGKLASPWYDATIADMTDVQVAQELDIDYAGSLEARVYPEFSAEVHVLPTIAYEPKLGLEGWIDFGLDTTSIGIVQDAPDSVRMLCEFEIGDVTPEQVVAGLREMMRMAGIPERLLEPMWMRQMMIVGDPAGESRELGSAESLVSLYQKVGLSIYSKRRRVGPTVIAGKRLLLGRPKAFRISGEACPLFVTHLENNTWQTDREGRRKPGDAFNDDEHNHAARAYAYYCAYKFPPPVEGETDVAESELLHANLGDPSGKIDPGLGYGMKL